MLYADKGDPAADSIYFRVRLATFLCHDIQMHTIDLANLFAKTMGIRSGSFDQLVMDAPIERLLSFLTPLYEALSVRARGFSMNRGGIEAGAHTSLLEFVSSAFREEGLAYTIDSKGGVHPFVDAEFQRNRQSALRALGGSRYSNVDYAFQAAFGRLTLREIDTKAAVRDIFDAAESLFKLILAPKNPELTARAIEKELLPIIARTPATSDAVARHAMGRALSAFAKWVEACRPYRHGQQAETVVAPPLELALLLLSQGASFLRWLGEIDQRVLAKSPPRSD